jgi:hypothetical protein
MHTTTLAAPTKVAHVLATLIDGSGKSRKEIACAAGLGKPNMISMLKAGDTKLPLARLGSFANAVGADPVELLKLCLQEYYPDVWIAINLHLTAAITPDELRIVEALRKVTGVPCPSSINAQERERLDELLAILAKSSTAH